MLYHDEPELGTWPGLLPSSYREVIQEVSVL